MALLDDHQRNVQCKNSLTSPHVTPTSSSVLSQSAYILANLFIICRNDIGLIISKARIIISSGPSTSHLVPDLFLWYLVLTFEGSWRLTFGLLLLSRGVYNCYRQLHLLYIINKKDKKVSTKKRQKVIHKKIKRFYCQFNNILQSTIYNL